MEGGGEGHPGQREHPKTPRPSRNAPLCTRSPILRTYGILSIQYKKPSHAGEMSSIHVEGFHSIMTGFQTILFSHIRHQGKMTSALDRHGKGSLVLCAVAGDPPGQNLTPLGYIPLQLIHVLIIDPDKIFHIA